MKLHARILPLQVFCLAFALAGLAEGATILTATEDNFILRSAATTVQTPDLTALALKEATDVQTNSRTAYIKFDLTGVLPAEGDTATFTAFTTGSAGTTFTLQLYALNAGVTGFDWAEETITWNNSPAVSTVSADFYLDPAKTTALGSPFVLASGAGTNTPLSVTFSGWDSFRQADDSLTLLLVVTDQINGAPTLSVASSESTTITPPQLSIPEPAGVALLGLGASLVLGRRRSGIPRR